MNPERRLKMRLTEDLGGRPLRQATVSPSRPTKGQLRSEQSEFQEPRGKLSNLFNSNQL